MAQPYLICAHPARCAMDERNENEKGVPQIEVTPEMIEAAAKVIFYRCHHSGADASEWARNLASLVLEAALGASQHGPQEAPS
jgi:hypothetical protein